MRLIDADCLQLRVDLKGTNKFGMLDENIRDFIDTAPTIDAVPVVRCKDCKHIRPEVDAYTGETVGYWCAELDIGSIDVDDFCSNGERKEARET